jgi:hypothetical protein
MPPNTPVAYGKEQDTGFDIPAVGRGQLALSLDASCRRQDGDDASRQIGKSHCDEMLLISAGITVTTGMNE